MNKIKWRVEGFFKDADAEKVYHEIQECGEDYKAEDVLERAKDENSELHKCFEWEDSVAAEKWRLQQARLVITNLMVTVEKKDGTPTEFRLYQSNGREKGFSKSTIIARDIDRYSELLERAKAEMDAFRKRYANIVELQSVITEIEHILG